MSENVRSERKLRSNQVKAVEALASGLNQQEAAAVAGVTARTLRRWRQEPAFADAVREARQESLQAATDRLAFALERLEDVLLALAEDEEVRPRDRLKAVELVHNYALRFTTQVEFEERLQKLEEKLDGIIT